MSEEAAMRSEERRALVLLGITAILATFLSVMLAEVWSGRSKIEDFYFNFPPVSSPIGHVTFYWIPILEYMIGFWMVYALCVFWYLSVDWLSPETRNFFHMVATAFMGVYVLWIVPFVPLIYIGIVWITEPLEQLVYFVFALLLMGVLERDFMKFAVGEGYTGYIPRTLRRLRQRFRRRRSLIGATD